MLALAARLGAAIGDASTADSASAEEDLALGADSSPFGETDSAGEDPFGAEDSAEEADDSDPFASGEDDPFGDSDDPFGF